MSDVSVDLNLRLRPVRFAFLVRPNDVKNIEEAFRINSCLWGGRYNPIIPFFKKVPKWWDKSGHSYESSKQILNGYLDFFEPDFIVEAEKGMTDGLGFDENRVIQFRDVIKAGQSRYDGGYGQDVNDLYTYLYNKEFKYVKRHEDEVLYVKAKDAKFSGFVSCLYGSFPINKELNFFEKNFKHIFDPNEILLTDKSFIETFDKPKSTVLGLTRAELNVDYNDRSYPALFVLDVNEYRDLIDFWNLRIVRNNIIPIPKQWIESLSNFCKKFINTNYKPLPNNRNGIMIQPTVMFSRSIQKSEADELFQQYIKVDNKEANRVQQWYPALWRQSPDYMVRTTRPTVTAKKKRLELRLDSEKPDIKFEVMCPEFISEYGNRFRFANVVTIDCWGDKNNIATTFLSDYRKSVFPNFRLGREDLLSTNEGLVFFPEFISIAERWELCSGTEAMNSWFANNKITVVPSPAGRATQQIIQTLNGFGGVGKLAKPGIVKILDEMSRKTLTRSMHYAEFKNKIKNALGKQDWDYREFETLVERNAVQLGLQLKCTKCSNWGWHSITNVNYSIECEFCLGDFEFPITNPTESKYCKWAYRVIGPFALPDYAHGGYASALAIRFFNDILGRITNAGITWSAGQELCLSTGKKIESDFILWYQRKEMFGTNHNTEIVFGEAKSFGRDVFKDNDVDNAKLLAKNYPGSFLVFATMKDGSELSEEEVARIRKLAEWGREYDRDRKQTRAPVIVLTGTELFANGPLAHIWGEKGGMHKELIEPAYISSRLENLSILSDLTQQLYLNMPSYEEWLMKKRGII